ncbi:MAG: CoA-binding protein [Brumimicrobium sp.]
MKTKKTLVVGASTKEERYSNKAIKMLQEYGHPIVAWGRRKGEVNGVEIVTEFPTDNDIDTVTLYLSPSNQVEFYQPIIDIKPKRIIFNPGTENDDFVDLLTKNNIESEIACTLVLLRSEQY